MSSRSAVETLTGLAYWPRQIVVGFFRLWQFNGPLVAARLTLNNLLSRRRLFLVDLFGFKVSLRSGSPDLAVAIDNLGAEFAALTARADHGGLIIDGGGYIGTAAIRLARSFPTCHVVTVEPATENLALLYQNVAPFPNITVVEAALATNAAGATLCDPGRAEWGLSTRDEPGAKPLRRVPTCTIDDILAAEQADRLFIVKLDIEGAEREVLAAAKDWLARTEILVAEVHEDIAPGALAAFIDATKGRRNHRLPGEKWLSVAADDASEPAAADAAR